jgi:hypothetical protein
LIEIRVDEGLELAMYVDGQRLAPVVKRIDAAEVDLTLWRGSTSIAATLKAVLAHRLSDLPQLLGYLTIPVEFPWCEAARAVVIWRQSDSPEYTIAVSFDTGTLTHWKRPYSYVEFGRELLEIVSDRRLPELSYCQQYGDDFIGGFALGGAAASGSTLQTEINRLSEILPEFVDEAERRLISRVRQNSLVMYFDFPEQVRAPCEQYLLYFVEFLRDLGVEARTELKEEAGQVLFAVTPVDANQALSNIRTALVTYLELASSPLHDSNDAETAIEVQKLTANIHHLKGQIMLASAMLQARDAMLEAKDATIQAQSVTIERLLPADVFVDSLRTVYPGNPEGDKEKLLDGMVAITKYEGKGFQVDLPEIFRRLRAMFRRDN